MSSDILLDESKVVVNIDSQEIAVFGHNSCDLKFKHQYGNVFQVSMPGDCNLVMWDKWLGNPIFWVQGFDLKFKKNVPGGLGPIINIENGGGGIGTGVAIDFNTQKDNHKDRPTARIQSIDDGKCSSDIVFYTKEPGDSDNQLEERLRIKSNGDLRISSNEMVVNSGSFQVNMQNKRVLSMDIDLYDNKFFSLNDVNARFSKHAPGALGPVLTLSNTAGAAGAGAAIDFNGYNVGRNPPTARIQSIDDGNSSSDIAFYTKEPGADNNPLKERLRVSSNGNVKYNGDLQFVHYGVESGETRFKWDDSNTSRDLLVINNDGQVNIPKSVKIGSVPNVFTNVENSIEITADSIIVKKLEVTASPHGHGNMNLPIHRKEIDLVKEIEELRKKVSELEKRINQMNT